MTRLVGVAVGICIEDVYASLRRDDPDHVFLGISATDQHALQAGMDLSDLRRTKARPVDPQVVNTPVHVAPAVSAALNATG